MSELQQFFGGDEPDRLLTFAEALALVKCSRTVFWRVRTRKKLRVYRICGKGFVLRSELIRGFYGQ
jgi:hypothetical protein